MKKITHYITFIEICLYKLEIYHDNVKINRHLPTNNNFIFATNFSLTNDDNTTNIPQDRIVQLKWFPKKKKSFTLINKTFFRWLFNYFKSAMKTENFEDGAFESYDSSKHIFCHYGKSNVR